MHRAAASSDISHNSGLKIGSLGNQFRGNALKVPHNILIHIGPYLRWDDQSILMFAKRITRAQVTESLDATSVDQAKVNRLLRQSP
jgi:hypothetical protein